MFKRLHFRTPFDTEHAKGAKTLQKYAREHFYHILPSISGKLRDKMSLLVICKILGLFANTLTADDKYSPRYKEDLPQTIQRQLSNKKKNLFLNLLLPF